MTTRAVLSLSGGLDSATLLGWLLSDLGGFSPKLTPDEVCAVNFWYGSKHNKKECRAAEALAAHYGVNSFHSRSVTDMLGGGSSLTDPCVDVPEGHYTHESMKSTVVPGRNLVFLSVLASLAESLDCRYVFLGVHAGDLAIYPDCRPEFVSAANEVIRLSTENRVGVRAPFLFMDKARIVGIGLGLSVPYAKTWTCYNGRDKPCGKCGSCVERVLAFKENRADDPAEYETDRV